jgi:uncharacterized membrane protein YhhN
MRKTVALALFGIAVSGVLVAELIAADSLYMICKPLVMASLLFYYLFSVKPFDRSRSLILAIVFSFAGDVLLMREENFIAGLLAFLIAHILYIFAYNQHRAEEMDSSFQGLHRLRLAFPVILGGTGLIVILFPVLGGLKLPVMIYAMVLMIMVITAIFRMGRTSPSSFWMVAGGAALFMISDSMLAVNKFLHHFAYAEFWIMLIYSAAQYLIVAGLIKHNIDRPQ